MNELTISNGANSMERAKEMAAKVQKTKCTIETLSKMNNRTANALVGKQVLLYKYQMGYVLGSFKANLDCLPDDIAEKQMFCGVSLKFLIKMKVDEFVLDIRETLKPCEMTAETEYFRKYRRLSECICGFGYNMSFIEERFEQFFPDGMHLFVLGFAEGYSETFHEIAGIAKIDTQHTDPKTQDIWRNWEFFLKRDCEEYRLDGKYLFMYHGGYNGTGDPSIPCRNNEKIMNEGVYAALKARNATDFVNQQFDDFA